jgi:uncharacterized protein YbjT (DUF2867 family)
MKLEKIMAENKIIVVTGATGNQGGAVVKHLLSKDFTIKAVSRNLHGKGADKLGEMGVEVVFGDLDKPETLTPILKGVYGVYSVQNNWTSSIAVEIAQGKSLADAAKAAGVEHFVYSSVGGAERHTGIPHFDSKGEIERHIAKIGLPYTFVRPAYFVENFLAEGSFAFINWSLLSWALKKNRKIQFAAVDDIGAYVALVFSQPDSFMDQAIELAGDEKTFAEIKEIYMQVMGKKPSYLTMPGWLFSPMSKEMSTMFTWFKNDEFQADIPALRDQLPQLKSLKQALTELKGS